MAVVEDSKKRKTPIEMNIGSDDDDATAPPDTQSTGGSSDPSSAATSGFALIMKQLASMQETAADTKTEESNWRLVQNENFANTTREIAGLSASISSIDGKVVTLQADFPSLKGRVCALEGGGAAGNKGKGKTASVSTPRGSADPWSAPGGDPWSGYHSEQAQPETQTTNSTPDTSNPYALAKRVGNRTTLIFGGFPRDTSRGDMEMALRDYAKGFEGVTRVGSLGKYGNTGRINFQDNKEMWGLYQCQQGR